MAVFVVGVVGPSGIALFADTGGVDLLKNRGHELVDKESPPGIGAAAPEVLPLDTFLEVLRFPEYCLT